MSDYMDVDMDVDPAIVQIPVADQKLTPSEALLHGILIEQDLDFTPAACRYLLQTSGELRARLTSVASSDSFGPLESSDYINELLHKIPDHLKKTLPPKEAASILVMILGDEHHEFLSHSNCAFLVQNDSDLFSWLRSFDRAPPESPKKGLIRQHIVDYAPVLMNRLFDDEDTLTHKIGIYLAEITPSMIKLAKGQREPQTWLPSTSELPNVPEEIISHLTQLKIPCHPRDIPSLILHDIGAGNVDLERLNSLFGPACNTIFTGEPGTGKTRLVLEGLCAQYGLYLTPVIDMAYVGPLGSRDMDKVITSLLPCSPGFETYLSDEVGSLQTASRNKKIAWTYFQRVLLSRLLIFNLFLDCVVDPTQIGSGVYKRRWLLAQLIPSLLRRDDIDIRSNDVFQELASKMSRCSDELCQSLCSTVISRINQRLRGPFYCVFDDAQLARMEHGGTFRSIQDPSKYRSVIAEIIGAWQSLARPFKLIFLITGTSDTTSEIQCTDCFDDMPELPVRVYRDSGCFRDAEERTAYLMKYLPRELLETGEGMHLIDKVLQLGSRFGITAGFLQQFVRAGLAKPLTVLKDFVQTMTN